MATEQILSSQEFGEGSPILIIHGWTMDGKYEQLDFEPIFTKTTGFRRIYVDLPGHGLTRAHNISNADDIFASLVQFINTRLDKSRFLIVGTSYGGYLARALAMRYIKQVDGLLLRVPVVDPDNSLRDRDGFQPLVVDEKLWSTVSSEDKKLFGDISVQAPGYIKALKAKYEQAVNPALKLAKRTMLESIRRDPRRYGLTNGPDDKISQFLAPTLIVCGRQDRSVGYRDAFRLLEFYPRSTYIALDRGEHALPVDQVALFEAVVRDWLSRVDEWQGHAAKL